MSPKQHFSSELLEHMRIRTQTSTHNQIARSGDIKSFWELVWAGVYKQTGLPMCVCLCQQAIMCGSAHVVWTCTLKVRTTVCPLHGDGIPGISIDPF